MSLQDDVNALISFFNFTNQNNDVPPVFFASSYGLTQPSSTRTEGAPGVYLPSAAEAARVLKNLRQRRMPGQTGRRLVDRIRVEVRSKNRPKRDVPVQSLSGTAKLIGDIGGQSTYSLFQIDGWSKVLSTLTRAEQGQAAALAVTGPTGSGKTEVFVLPQVLRVAQGLSSTTARQSHEQPRYVMIYPRVALAQDQITRVFKFVRSAEVAFNLSGRKRIIVGLQFTGIRASLDQTLRESGAFTASGNSYTFNLLASCPWCAQPNTTKLMYRAANGNSELYCPVCQSSAVVSLSKDDHVRLKPQLLLTTAESLDRMYLDWDFRDYVPLIHAVTIDEAHIFNQIYGAHIHHLLQRLRSEVRNTHNRELGFIIASATIADPTDFVTRLCYGTNPPPQAVDAVEGDKYPADLSGAEALYILQASRGPGGRDTALSTMIQAMMATGHAMLPDSKRAIAFVNSLDIGGRLQEQLEDAESTTNLWAMRVANQSASFGIDGQVCPHTTPYACTGIYEKGECWRGILGGINCWKPVKGLRQSSMPLQLVTGNTTGSRSFQAPMIIGTSALEVGVDDSTVQATLHFRPPRTVFDFIQRRGRAGRANGELFYTVLVLGQEASDYYYLTRRHRVIDGSYELPLNPDNPVVRVVHEWLEKARIDAFALIRRRGQREFDGMWQWVTCQLVNCVHIQARYSTDLQRIQQSANGREQHGRIQAWVESGLEDALKQLGAEWDIPKRRAQLSDPVLVALLDDLAARFNEWLDNVLTDAQFQSEVSRLRSAAANFVAQATSGSPTTVSKEFSNVFEAIMLVEQMAQQTRAQVQRVLLAGRTWYDFFTRLRTVFDGYHSYTLFDVVRIVYQAMYALHLGLGADNCPADIPVYVPDSYFSSVKQMRVEVPGNRVEGEDITSLATAFRPYRLNYRYEARQLYTLETRSLGIVRNDSIRLRPDVEGTRDRDPDGQDVVVVKGIRVRQVRGDSNQNVGICQNCLEVYDAARQSQNCRCGGQIVPSSVAILKTYSSAGFESTTSLPVASTFEYVPEASTWTTIRGTRVSIRPQGGVERKIKAWLNPSLHFRMNTRAIRWRVPGLVARTRDDQLHAAGHILLKAMSSVVGVREDQLAYKWDTIDDVVTVWEKYEGGAGLCEIFIDTLQKDPARVYKEMVGVVACPIFLAEQKGTLWQTAANLTDYVCQEFGLPPTDTAVGGCVSEAVAETSYQDPAGVVCSRFDGCPACIDSGECREDTMPSRSIAWNLVKSLVKQVPVGQSGGSLVGTVLWSDRARSIDHVLVL